MNAVGRWAAGTGVQGSPEHPARCPAGFWLAFFTQMKLTGLILAPRGLSQPGVYRNMLDELVL